MNMTLNLEGHEQKYEQVYIYIYSNYYEILRKKKYIYIYTNICSWTTADRTPCGFVCFLEPMIILVMRMGWGWVGVGWGGVG